jgi:hypothetical protein
MASFNKAKEIKKAKKQWWIIHTQKYSFYIWALPILPIVLLSDYIKEYNSKKRVWSEETATKVLDKVLPQILEWVEEDNAFYYCMSWGTSPLYRKAPRKYRKWADKFEYQLQRFIKEGYENADYVKTVEKDYYDTWVKFVEK